MSVGFKQATVASGDVPSTQSDFPVYVDLKRMNGGSSMTQAEADSIRVYADSAKTTEWAREIVSVDEMHVKIPSLTSTTTIYVDWDGSRSDYAATDTYGRNAVWGDYEMIYHFKEGSGTTTTNATGGTDATLTNSALWSNDAKIGDATGIEGNGSAYITTFTLGSFDDFSLSMWWKPKYGKAASDGINSRQFGFRDGNYRIDDFRDARSGSGANDRGWDVWDMRSNVLNNTGSISFDHTPAGEWLLGTVTSNRNGNIRAYVDAVDRANTTTNNAGIVNNTHAMWLMTLNNGGSPANTSKDKISEFRFRKSALSADWITTEYNNQSDESGFWGTWSDVTVATDTTKFFNMM